MPVISLQNVSKVYRLAPQLELRRLLQHLLHEIKSRNGVPGPGIRYALRDVNLEIEAGESLGVIGRNGAGKSTLLRLLAGLTLPTKGRIRVEGRVSSLIGLGVGFHGELTGRENLYLYGSLMGLRTKQIRARIDDIAAFADIGDHMDVAFKRYSSGMMARLSFAAALYVEPGILLLDEVLAVGDRQFYVKSMAALRQLVKRCTLVFVSHSMEAVAAICSRAVWFDEGVVRADGPVADVVAAYLAAQQAALARPTFAP